MTQNSNNSDGFNNTFDPYLTWAELTKYAGFSAKTSAAANPLLTC